MQTQKDIKCGQKRTSNTNATRTLNTDKKGHYLKTPCMTVLAYWREMCTSHLSSLLLRFATLVGERVTVGRGRRDCIPVDLTSTGIHL